MALEWIYQYILIMRLVHPIMLEPFLELNIDNIKEFSDKVKCDCWWVNYDEHWHTVDRYADYYSRYGIMDKFKSKLLQSRFELVGLMMKYNQIYGKIKR